MRHSCPTGTKCFTFDVSLAEEYKGPIGRALERVGGRERGGEREGEWEERGRRFKGRRERANDERERANDERERAETKPTPTKGR